MKSASRSEIVRFALWLFVVSVFLGSFLRRGVSATAGPPFVNVRRKVAEASPGTDPGTFTRVHGGFEAPQGKFKFMVFLLISESGTARGAKTCSASLIAEKWVLTAAHCVTPASNPSVIAVGGKSDLRWYFSARTSVPFHAAVHEEKLGIQERRAVRIHVNPRYSASDHYNDLALLELNRPFETGDGVEIAKLSENKMLSPMSCTVVGWGLSDYQTQTFKLMYAEGVSARTPDLCHFLSDGRLICLEKGGPGICKGDSGSPLMCDDAIWGVASFSLSAVKNPGCSDEQEEYYSAVFPELAWIEGTMLRSSGESGSRTLGADNSVLLSLILVCGLWFISVLG